MYFRWSFDKASHIDCTYIHFQFCVRSHDIASPLVINLQREGWKKVKVLEKSK